MANQLVANGVNIPNVDGASAGIQAAAGAVKGAAATNLKGVDDCVPTDQTDKQSKKFVTDYKAKFGGETPVYSAAETYDMINFAAAIAAKQGAVTPKAMLKGLATQAWAGVCMNYKGDAIQVLGHSRRHREVRRQRRRDHREEAHHRAGPTALHRGDDAARDDGGSGHHHQGSVIRSLRDNQALVSGRRG